MKIYTQNLPGIKQHYFEYWTPLNRFIYPERYLLDRNSCVNWYPDDDDSNCSSCNYVEYEDDYGMHQKECKICTYKKELFVEVHEEYFFFFFFYFIETEEEYHHSGEEWDDTATIQANFAKFVGDDYGAISRYLLWRRRQHLEVRRNKKRYELLD